MISVYLVRPNDTPNFYAQWVIPGTTRRKTRSLRTANPDVAERRRIRLEVELNEGLDSKGQARIKWADFLERWQTERLAENKDRKKARSCLDRFTRSQKPASVADVTSQMISAHAARLRSEGLKPVTVRTHLAWVRAALRWAWKMEMIRHCPHVESVKVPKGRKIRHVPIERFADLLAAMPSEAWQLLVRIAWHTGMRRGEMFDLLWHEQEQAPWVNLARKRIVFPGGTSKADREDWIPIHPDLLAHLQMQGKTAGPVCRPAVNPMECSREFGELAQAAGLNIKLHDLRRSFGTRYAPHVPAHVLQRLMRHADIKTTLEYYADVDPTLDEAIKKA